VDYSKIQDQVEEELDRLAVEEEIRNKPKVGDRKPYIKPSGRQDGYLIWHECIQCAEGSWVRDIHVLQAEKYHYKGYCSDCGRRVAIQAANAAKNGKSRFGVTSPHWKGGTPGFEGGATRDKGGYKMVALLPDDPYYEMAIKPSCHDGKPNLVRYCFEHRYVMAKHLGRLLQPWEIVHHGEKGRGCNELSNLELKTRSNHPELHLQQSDAKFRRVRDLEDENEQLSADVAHLNQDVAQLKLRVSVLENENTVLRTLAPADVALHSN
jgi:hypothetical protein